jgi:hypothetical protein
MFKKLIITGAAAGLLLVSAAGAFADSHGHQSLPTTTVTISNSGSVSNNVSASTNTGYNGITGGSVKNSGITTGAATSGSSVTTQLNFNQFGCGCVLGLGGTGNVVFSLGNSGTVSNTVGTSANTGYNTIMAGSSHHEGEGGSSNGGVSGSWITTGAAASSSVVSNVVNTNVFGSVTP